MIVQIFSFCRNSKYNLLLQMNNKPAINLFTQMSKPPLAQPKANNENKSNNSNIGTSLPTGVSYDANHSTLSEVSRRRPKRSREVSLFRENRIDNYFSDLFPLLRNKRTQVRVQTEILSLNSFKQWLKQGLDEFRPNKANDDVYQKNYKGKPFLNLMQQEIGFPRVVLTTSPHSQKIDTILSKVVDILSKELGTSSLTVTKMLRKFLREGTFYPRLYFPEIGNDVLKPNTRNIDRFFLISDPNIVNENSPQFQILLARCIEYYFDEFYACLSCLGEALNIKMDDNEEQGQQRRGLPSLLKKERNERSLGRILWENYCNLSEGLLSAPAINEEKQNNAVAGRKKMRQAIFGRKVRMFTELVRLFLKTLNTHETVAEDTAADMDNFWKNAIERVDKNIIEIQSSANFHSNQASVLNKQLTELFLALFPWHFFYERDPPQARNQSILGSLKNVKSDSLRPIQILLIEIVSNKNGVTSQIMQKISKQITEGEWPVHNFHWKKWLGLFLRVLQNTPLARYMPVLRHVVWLCKAVMKEEHQKFWEVASTAFFPEHQQFVESKSYMHAIYSFLSAVLTSQSKGRLSVTVTHILPILTASLGHIESQHTLDLIVLMGFQNIQLYILDQISSSLNLQDRQNEKNTRIIYIEEQKDKNVEQEIKLLCRMVELNCNQLFDLQSKLFEVNILGLKTTVFLCKVLQRLQPVTVEDIKCLRYIIKALDAIFMNVDTRILLPMALGVTQSGKWSCSKVIRQIVDMCSQIDGPSEMARQCSKLREVFSIHIYNILRVSNSLDQYFPSGSRRQDEKRYETLDQLLKHENIEKIKYQFIYIDQPPLKAVSWLHDLLLILESSKLSMLDLQIIIQLLQKFRIEKWMARQFSNLEVVLQIMNNGKIAQNMTDFLTPSIGGEGNANRHLFGLVNIKMQSFMVSSQSLDSNLRSNLMSAKYASKQYRLGKVKKMKDKELKNIYGQISSSLRVIETVLKLNIEGQFELVKRLRLNEWIMDSLVGKGYFYEVPFMVKLQQSGREVEQRAVSSSRVTKMVEHALTTSINLMHTIASLLDFQSRYQISQELHPSRMFQPKGFIYYSLDSNQGNEINHNALTRAQFSILSSQYSKDSVSVSVLQIIDRVIVLGFEKQAYLSISNRVYPRNKTLSNQSISANIFNQFFKLVMSMLSRPQPNARFKQICLQFMFICAKNSKFSEFIKLEVLQFKEPFIACLDYIETERGLAMTARLLLFFNLLLADRPNANDVRFVKACLVDVSKFGQKISLISRAIFRDLRPAPENANAYSNLVWSKSTKECTLCKIILLLYLGILSVMLNTEPQFTASFTCNWILSQSQIFLSAVPAISIAEFQSLGTECANNISKIRQEQNKKGYLEFADSLYHWLIFDIQGSLGEDFAFKRWEAYHRVLEREELKPENTAIKSLQLSTLYSLQMSQEALSQFYCTVLLGLFQRGSYGYSFLKGRSEYSKRFTNQIGMSLHSPNCLSGDQILPGGQQFLRKGFTLIRNLLEDIQIQSVEKQLRSCKNSAVLLLAQIIAKMSQVFLSDPGAAGAYYSDAARLIDRVFAYISCSNFQLVQEEAIVVLAAVSLKLSQSVFILSKINSLTLDSIRCYLQSILQAIDITFGKISSLSVVKLEHVILDQQLANLIALESHSKQLRHYVTALQRRIQLQKLAKGLEMAVDILEDSTPSDGIKSLAMQLFSKMFQIDSITRSFSIESQHSFLNHKLSNRLEQMSLDQGESELVSGLFLTALISEAAASSPNQWMRLIVRVLNANNEKMLRRVSHCGSAQSLWAIIEARHIFSALINILSPQNWKNPQIGKILSKLFQFSQEHIQRFDGSRVAPTNDFQSDLALRKVTETEQNVLYNSQYQSIFSILVELRMHEMARYFLLFMLGAFKYCPLLSEFCDKTIFNGPLDDHTWQRLKITLEQVCDFLSNFGEHLRNGATTMINVNHVVCRQSSFAGLGIRTFFEFYKDENDLLEDSMDTVFILTECIGSLIKIWRSYDWKSRLNWKPSRKVLLSKGIQTLNGWLGLSKKLGSERSLKEKIYFLNQQLSECQQAN